MSKAVDTYCRIILGITILICIIPTARADQAVNSVQSYLLLSIYFTIFLLLISLGYLLRSRKIEKNRKIIRAITILLVVGLVLQSFLFVNQIVNQRDIIEQSKPPFQYYVMNRSVDEISLSGGSIGSPESVVYHNNSFVMAHISEDYVSHFNSEDSSFLYYLIIRNRNVSGEEKSSIVIEHGEFIYGSSWPSSWPRMCNAVLTVDGGILTCYYSILNYDLQGNNVSKMTTSLDGINWSDPEIIESHPFQFNYKDEITFPSKFEGYGFTHVHYYNIFKTSSGFYIMTIAFEEYRGDTVSSIGTFISFSTDGENWSELIQIVEPYKLDSPVICEVSPGTFVILYTTGYGSFYVEFTFDDLQDVSGPIFD